MNNLRFAFAVGILLSCGVENVQAQFYGSGFGYGGFGGYNRFGYNGFGYNRMGYSGFGPNMGAFAPPMAMGGFYSAPTVMPGGAVGGYGINTSSAVYGFATPGPPGGIANGSPFNGYPGFGWWPMSASDVRVTAIRNPESQGAVYVPDNSNPPSNQQASTNPSSDELVVHTGASIKLTNPKSATDSLAYLLNGYPYTMPPGYSQTFPDDRSWKLEFRRAGEGSEWVAYTLKPGKYNVGIGSNGWELRRVVSLQPSDVPPAPVPTPIVSAIPTVASSSPTPLPPP